MDIVSPRSTSARFWFALAAGALWSCSQGSASTATTGSGGGQATTGSGGQGGASCVEPAEGPPADVFCTGLYENHDVNQRSPSAVPYTPGITFWSDGAEKQRFLSLPPSAKIDTSSMDAWKFPVGTKAWKEFRLNGALVETRFLWKRSETKWAEATYIWASDGKSAVLTELEKPTLLEGGYEIPGLKSCRKCHGGAGDELLGVEAVALALPTAEGISLASLAAAGSLSAPPAKTAIALPEDATGKAAAALGFLHMNCGTACHSTRGLSGFTQLHTRLRAEEFWPPGGGSPAAVEATDAYTTGVNQAVILGTYQQAFPGTSLIKPGAHDKSLAWLTAHLRGEHQMPPIVSHKIDETGTQKLADWIDALPP